MTTTSTKSTQQTMAHEFIERIDQALRIVEEWPADTPIPRSTETALAAEVDLACDVLTDAEIQRAHMPMFSCLGKAERLNISMPDGSDVTALCSWADDIAQALEGRPPRDPEPHFRTHFQARRLPGENLLRRLGRELHEQSSARVSHDRIRTEQTSHLEVAGLRISLDQKANTVYLAHVMEARTSGHEVRPVLQNREIILTGLCRPRTFAQAVNHMLASPQEPPLRKCAGCRDYVRWQTAGNQGECQAEDPEDADCPVQGNDRWCPAHRA